MDEEIKQDPSVPEGVDAPEDAEGKQAEKVDEQQKENDGTAVGMDDELSKLAVAKALGMDKISDLKHHEDQVQRLVEYAQSQGAKSVTDIIVQLNALRSEVGMNKNVYNLSVYAGLALERAHIEEQMKKFKNE